MLRFKSATPSEIRAAIDALYQGQLKSPSAYYTQTAAGLSLVRAAYAGGQEALNLLIRKPGESNTQWLTRQRYFENRPIVEVAVSERAEDVYGDEPERCFYLDGEPESDLSKEVDEFASGIYDANGACTLFRNRVGVGMVRDKFCWVKVWADSIIGNNGEPIPTGDIRFGYIPREQVGAVFDPDDADTVLGFYEVRPGRMSRQYNAWLWTLDSYGQIDDDWKEIGGTWKDNPVPGVLPFVCFGDYYGRDPMGDAVLMQRTATNARSLTLLGARSQMYSTPVAIGDFKTSEFVDPMTGEKGVRMGSPDAMVQMQGGGSFTFQNPNIDLQKMLDLEMMLARDYANSLRVSLQSVDPSAAPEQPMALAIRERRSQAERRRWIQMVTPAEEHLGKVIMAYAYAFSPDVPAFPLDALDVDIEFPVSTLPMDRQMERSADQADVAASPPRMTVPDYVKKWIMPGASDDEVKRYVAQLGAQSESSAVNRATSLGMPLPARAPGSALAALLGTPRAGDRVEGVGASGGNGATVTAPPSGGYPGGSGTSGPVPSGRRFESGG